MNETTRERLFGCQHALDHPLVGWVGGGVAMILVLTPLCIALLSKLGKLDDTQRRELWQRFWSWLIFIPMMFGPILLGAAWIIAAVGLLSVFCYREFARATGLFRERIVSALVVLGIFAITFAVADHWYGLFMALAPLTIGGMATMAILPDQPKGYIQRVALGIFSFMLFGVCYGHLGYFANDGNFRAILIWLLVCVELNDIFAFLVGKTLGHRKLAPNTSPNKTLGGALGALVLTTALAAALGHMVFRNTAVDQPVHLFVLGVLVSITGQLGDLTLSSIKRDLGIKDWAATFPGHGGLLDRFNSLIFAAPAVFHYIGYLRGVGLDQTPRIITGG
ncbi:MAG: phosphatidate cytidylyltransferase [Verrucomicrobia bacterium]|nr:phosphatidate cytidylyltransferase [Verrucomicrobiota bacterium]